MTERFFDEEVLIGLRRVNAVSPSPCGTWLAVEVERLKGEDRAEYVSDIWRVPVDGGEPRLLTRGDYNDGSPSFRHDGALAFLSNRPTPDEDEKHEKRRQVWVFPADGGDPECLTKEPLGVSSFDFAENADVLVVVASMLPNVDLETQREEADERAKAGPSARLYRDMPVRFWDHWLPEQAPHLIVYRDGARRDLTPGADRQYRNSSWDVSPDGGKVAVKRYHVDVASDRIRDAALDLIDTKTGDVRVLAESPRTWFFQPKFSPDGSRIAVGSQTRLDEAHGRPGLEVFAVDGSDRKSLADDFDGWLQPSGWSRDGKKILSVVHWQGDAPVFAVDVESGAIDRITSEASGGHHAAVSALPGEKARLVGIRDGILQPPEPFVVDLEPGAEPLLLANLSQFEGVEAAVEIEEHEVTSTDGEMVQYRVVRPADADGKLPMVLWIHGGPISAWLDQWHWRWNPLVGAARGHVMVLPNPRGSTGFGQDFVEGIWGNVWGAQCYEDLMRVTDAVGEREDVDEDHMVAMGGSFGGYMTNWIGCQSARFSCLVSHAGLTKLSAFHGVTDSPAWWTHMFGVSPYDESREMDLYSPFRHVEDWETPTLVIHGQQDYRVPVGEALTLFEALQHYGVESELLIFPDENHWILKPRNVVAWYQHVFRFIGDYV